MGSYGKREIEQDNFPEDLEDCGEDLVFPVVLENTESGTADTDEVPPENALVTNEVDISGKTLPINDENIAHQTSNLIATLAVEKRHREGQKSDRKRTASRAENDHQPKKSAGRPKGKKDTVPREVWCKKEVVSLTEGLQDDVEQLKLQIKKQNAIIEEQEATIQEQRATTKELIATIESLKAQQQQMWAQIQLLCNWNYIQAGNQPLPKTKGASIQQSVFSTPNLPLNSKDALNESLSSATFRSVHPPNQLSVTAVSQNTFNHGGGTNNASVVPSQVPNTTTNGVLFDTSVRSYQQMGNRFVSTNQQIPDLTSKSFGSTLPQSSQYYQSSASHSGSASNQPLRNTCFQSASSQLTFNHDGGTNQETFNASGISSPVPIIPTDRALSIGNVGSSQQMVNPPVAINEKLNLLSNQRMFNPATTHNLLEPSSSVLSTQPQLNQYFQSSVPNSGGFIRTDAASNQLLPNNTYKASVQRIVSPAPSLPVIPADELNQLLPDTALPSVQPSNQHSIATLSWPIFNEGIESNQQEVNSIIGFSQTANSAPRERST